MKKTRDNKKDKNEDISKGLELLERGINLGGIVNKNREDWHRRVGKFGKIFAKSK